MAVSVHDATLISVRPGHHVNGRFFTWVSLIVGLQALSTF